MEGAHSLGLVLEDKHKIASQAERSSPCKRSFAKSEATAKVAKEESINAVANFFLTIVVTFFRN